MVKTYLTRPMFKALRFPVIREVTVIAAVALLFFPVCPSYCFWPIDFSVSNSVECVSVGRWVSHIGVKVDKPVLTAPTVTYCDTYSPIGFVGFDARVITTLQHPPIDAVDSSSVFTMPIHTIYPCFTFPDGIM